jgi:hypothetical protein
MVPTPSTPSTLVAVQTAVIRQELGKWVRSFGLAQDFACGLGRPQTAQFGNWVIEKRMFDPRSSAEIRGKNQAEHT